MPTNYTATQTIVASGADIGLFDSIFARDRHFIVLRLRHAGHCGAGMAKTYHQDGIACISGDNVQGCSNSGYTHKDR
ncbi:hypothetical protein THS27_25555 [Thalassospira sp. MCCC 1A01428]|nr:hypothetical protein THS27_25555 [Thalassospira sp. MCCC 1A01428]